jgi:integrase
MFLKDGSAWRKSHQLRPIAKACRRAKIDPPINFHALRHTWASLATMNGFPLLNGFPPLIVAKNLGHSDTRMVERHYGHLAPSYIVAPYVSAPLDLAKWTAGDGLMTPAFWQTGVVL